MSARWIDIGAIGEVSETQPLSADLDGFAVVVVRCGEALFAIEDRCTHDDGPLAEGRLYHCEIECPRHGAKFDIRTGRVTALPAIIPVGTYDVTVNGNDVLVDVEV